MKGRANFWGEFKYVSDKQIELALSMNGYRRTHNMSQTEFAEICNLYGEPHGIKFSMYQISNYERMRKAPRKARFQILCNVLNMKSQE